MPKTIAEKIDFLMKLTNTRNSDLGQALNFDASYISRVRNGKRGLPKTEPFIDPAAEYFAARITEDYSKAAAANVLCLHQEWPADERESAELLAEWLASEQLDNPIDRFISAMQEPSPRMSASEAKYPATNGTRVMTSLYYGTEGRRDSVIAFLSELCESGKAYTLLLTSDEDMAWLFEDETFARVWASLMGRLIQNGSRIKIIHSIGRDANEMWEAVRKWLPLYMTGAIQPFYYPRLRDGLLHRSLFIAVGRSALCSVSTSGQTADSMIQLLRDRNAVKSMEQEFTAYLKLCRPLMEIVLPSEERGLERLLRAFVSAPGDLLVSFPDGALVGVKKSAIVAKVEGPRIAFVIEELRMVSAVEEYLRNLPDNMILTGESASEALQAFIEALPQEREGSGFEAD